MALAATVGLAGPAVAADLTTNDASTQVAQAAPSTAPVSPSSQTGTQQAAPPVAGSGGGGGQATYTINPSPPPSQNPYAASDQLKVRGWIVPLPGAADTLTEGLFGVRNDLAAAGISYFGFDSTTFQDNLIRHGHPPGVNSAIAGNSKQEQYDGQLPTYNSANALYFNYDLRRYGVPDGQITLGAYLLSNNWNPSGPNGFGLAQASYYQTLFNKQVEIKLGYLSNNLEFLGTQVGGNLASGIFGDNAPINYENGQNLGGFTTLGLNVKVNLPDNIYTKVGIQRALSPDGVVAERLQNPTGANFKVANAGVFVIDETGYRAFAAPGQMGTWIRAAANYTTSRYVDITTGLRHTSDFGLYFLADRQLIQTAPNAGPGSAVRGIYAGGTAMYSPSYFNVFSQYYEARFYGFGLIPGRPYDLISAVYNRNVFSDDAVRLARSFGELAHSDANTYTIAYSAHVLPGITLNAGFGYTDHPTVITYDGTTGSAFNFLTNLFTFF